MNRITLDSGPTFEAGDDESLLDAATRAGLVLPYSCRTGRCSTCQCQVVAGSTRALQPETGLTAAQQAEGWVLSCVRSAVGDVSLRADVLAGVTLAPARVWPCRIHSLALLAPDVLQVQLRLPPAARLPALAGQYIDVIGPGGLRRAYSLANAMTEGGLVELHIRRVPGGAMSAWWFEQAQPNDLLRLNGPLGTFVLRDGLPRQLLLLATGTGIAPVKALLEHLARTPAARAAFDSVRVYWGGRQPCDLYADPSAWLPGVHCTPVLSRADASWAGARGHVQQVALADAPDLADTVVMACGSEAMTIGARAAFITAGLPATRFLSDAFVSSAAA